SLGYRYASNANAAPDSPFVSVYDPFLDRAVRGELPEDALEQDDSSVQATARLLHSYAFAGSSGGSWDTDLLLYGVKFDDFSDLDQLAVRLETGPALVVAGGMDSPFQIRPYGTAGYYQLD